ncbi:MAG: alpha/beta fold hydrolase [Anaerolineae bacterium]|jgi:pimeloyl-ACP methyl ester carboxylesterase
MSAIVIGGGLIHYEAFGHGEPILFIHGWLGSWRYWMRTMEALASDYRTYALDLWGFGDSDKSKERYSVADYTTLIHDFMDQLGIAKASLVGHSLGAVVALHFAAEYPSLVSRLAIVSLPVTSDAINGRLQDFSSNSVLAKMFWWRQITHKEVQQETEKMATNVIALSVQSTLEIDARALIERIHQPTLVIYGEKDSVIDPEPSRILNGERHSLRPIGLAESRHFPMLEEANKFNRLLKDFLEAGDDLSDLELKEEWKRRTR